ncbi:MAG: bifunctional oligoribonuclease/PAP phosphatase NrnA [Elusimicrobia bacterium]|nr:bifunctional oligoribonuclease/PAP phosphatase NrnA [Elusimicrobiota bacterium]
MDKHTRKLSQILSSIKKCKTFFIAGHTKPDGDTIGASIALASLLKRLGKKAEIYSKEEVPYYLKFLKGSENIKAANKVNKKFDCAIILECSDLKRMGNIINKKQAEIFINIDHHRVFNNFGNINYIDPKASSSAEQIYGLFRYLKMKINKNEAEALYTGLVSDTGKFQFSNTTAKCFYMAADLINSGVRPEKMLRNIYEGNKISSLYLLGLALETLKLKNSGMVGYMHITNSMFRKAGSDYSETENIINYPMAVEGVIVGVLFRETEERDNIKVSLRSRGNIDVSAIAKHFGGGGHKNAAGLNLNGTLKEAEKKFFDFITDYLNG